MKILSEIPGPIRLQSGTLVKDIDSIELEITGSDYTHVQIKHKGEGLWGVRRLAIVVEVGAMIQIDVDIETALDDTGDAEVQTMHFEADGPDTSAKLTALRLAEEPC